MKVGDRVWVKYATFGGTESSVGKTFLVTGINKHGMVWLNDHFPSAQWSPHLPEALAVVLDTSFNTPNQHRVSSNLTPTKKPNAKQDAIKVDYVDVKGVPCVEILGFENILMEHELPNEYFKGRLHFDLRKSAGSDTYRSTFNGFEYQDRVATEGTPFIALNIPEPIKGFNYPYGLYIYQGDILRQDTFDTVMVWLKRAGARLAKINRKNREAMKQEPKGEWMSI